MLEPNSGKLHIRQPKLFQETFSFFGFFLEKGILTIIFCLCWSRRIEFQFFFIAFICSCVHNCDTNILNYLRFANSA
jgi:hypothetical protein